MGKADLKRWTRQNSTFKVFFTVILEETGNVVWCKG